MHFFLFIAALFVKVCALLAGIFSWNSLSLPLKLAFTQVVAALVCELGETYLISIYGENVWLCNIYMLVEILLLGIIATMLVNNSLIKRIVALLLVGLSIIWVMTIQRNGLKTLTNTFYLLGGIVLVMSYLAVLFNSSVLASKKVISDPVFWFSLSVIIYFGCYLPYKGLENYLMSISMELTDTLFNIILLLNYIRYPLVGLAFYLHGKNANYEADTSLTH